MPAAVRSLFWQVTRVPGAMKGGVVGTAGGPRRCGSPWHCGQPVPTTGAPTLSARGLTPAGETRRGGPVTLRSDSQVAVDDSVHVQNVGLLTAVEA
jgi:hypothetical protein